MVKNDDQAWCQMSTAKTPHNGSATAKTESWLVHPDKHSASVVYQHFTEMGELQVMQVRELVAKAAYLKLCHSLLQT